MSNHIQAKPGDIAERILLPGDPLRAKHIAETYLEDVSCFNQIRNMLGYTGMYKGKRLSVMGTGMGMPSMGIYAHELLADYGVKTLIRIGTCGTISEKAPLRSLILVQGTSNDSAINLGRFGSISYAPTADFDLLLSAKQGAEHLGIPHTVGNILTSDLFYDERIRQKIQIMQEYGVLAIEMESCELYTLAAKFGAKALSLLTVSDSLLSEEACTAEERQTSFHHMMQLALEIV